jgi:hypothetical protein
VSLCIRKGNFPKDQGASVGGGNFSAQLLLLGVRMTSFGRSIAFCPATIENTWKATSVKVTLETPQKLELLELFQGKASKFH